VDKTREGVLSMAVLLFFLCTVLFIYYHGRAGRNYPKTRVTYSVDSPQRSLGAWRASGARGRVLLLFDRGMGFQVPEDGQPETNDNYLVFAFRENAVRKVVHVVSDSKWDTMSRAISEIPSFSTDGVLHLTIEGTPVLISRVKDIPRVEEKVMLSANGDLWDLKEVAAALRDKSVQSDVVVLYGDFSEEEKGRFGLLP
jgi:hypothetical protein